MDIQLQMHMNSIVVKWLDFKRVNLNECFPIGDV